MEKFCVFSEDDSVTKSVKRLEESVTKGRKILLLLGHTDSFTTTSGSLRVLTTYPEKQKYKIFTLQWGSDYLTGSS